MDTTATHIEGLYDKAKKYTEDSIELYKLNAIDKTTVILSSLASRIALTMVVALFTLFINIGVSLYIGEILGSSYLGFLVLSGFYLLVGICIYFFKREWIEIPISNLVIKALLKSKTRASKNRDDGKE